MKNMTHYVDSELLVRVRKIWVIGAVFTLYLLNYVIKSYINEDSILIVGICAKLLAIGTFISGWIMKFSDEYEDYVEEKINYKRGS